MAEFQEVMRQFDRMCKANVGCFNCPLRFNCPLHEPDGVSDRCSIGAFVNDSERIEREVMKWAKEHPEPVYPTWYEYLEKVFDPEVTKYPNDAESFFYAVCTYRIKADIAQKLGIEPKEVK